MKDQDDVIINISFTPFTVYHHLLIKTRDVFLPSDLNDIKQKNQIDL